MTLANHKYITEALRAFDTTEVVEVMSNETRTGDRIVWLRKRGSEQLLALYLRELVSVGERIAKGDTPQKALVQAFASPFDGKWSNSVIDLRGHVYSPWICEEPARGPESNNQAHWSCRCLECGFLYVIDSSRVRKHTPKCPKCHATGLEKTG
jgi:hypothetical protein